MGLHLGIKNSDQYYKSEMRGSYSKRFIRQAIILIKNKSNHKPEEVAITRFYISIRKALLAIMTFYAADKNDEKT